MTITDKFNSDIQKAIKFDRANNGGRYDGGRACVQIANLLERYCRDVPSLARQIGDYWLNTYILESDDVQNEPSEKNVERFRAFYAFLSGDDDFLDVLSKDDFENLRDFVDDEADSLDLDSLQKMMSVLLEKGAL